MQEKQKVRRILFIGNSYTYYNDMPEVLFAGFAKEAGYPVEVYSATKGAAKLKMYANPAMEHSKILSNAAGDMNFDWVILQEQSHTPITDEETFHEGIAAMKNLFAGRTKHFLLYATWGRKEGSPKLEEMNMTSQEMTERLAAAYDRAGEKFDIPVVHVGKAFAAHRQDHPEEELYDPDLSHPSLAGSSLAAEEILKAIMG